MNALDLDFVRAQFPAFAEPSLRDGVFAENAGGSYACRQVIGRFDDYYRRLKLQPYYPYPASTEAGQWMDASHVRLAEYLNIAADDVHFGPSTSQNSYVLAQALGRSWRSGDEIVVSGQEHEANSGVWRRLAAQGGAVVREWRVDPRSGALDVGALDALLSPRTRLVAFTHCSNIVGQINPVAAICAKVRAAGALSAVDGVAFAPHGLPDAGALGADLYLFSLYKTFGPHQGLMVLRRELLDRLPNEGHWFNDQYPRKRLVPAGPDHAQIAAARGIAEYFDALDAHHGGGDVHRRPARVRDLLRGAELALMAPLLDWLRARSDVRVLGPLDAAQRAPTISFAPSLKSPAEIHAALARRRVFCAAGHFYAVRLLESVGIDPQSGVVRISLVHYNSPAEVERLIAGLDAAL